MDRSGLLRLMSVQSSAPFSDKSVAEHGVSWTGEPMTLLRIAFVLATAASLAGCADPQEKFGRTWYIDGAGNWGFGVLDVPRGLELAGYKGRVSNHHWSLTMNPALDQTLRFIAKGSGDLLGAEITDYLKRTPDADANIIALSAGTGVAVWAVEKVQPPYKVNNLFLLGSSLSSRYDLRPVLRNMKGDIYVYYAASDPVLQGPVRVLGTIDGTFDDAAGQVGLRGPGARTNRVHNIGWNSRYQSLGWTGGHADCTNYRFVRGELAKYIVPRRPAPAPGTPPQKPAVATGATSPSSQPSAELGVKRG